MLCVSAIQISFSYAASPQEFIDHVSAPIERAAASTDAQHGGALLVALPNYTGLMLLGSAVPAARGDLSLDAIARAAGCASVAAMLRAAASQMSELYVRLFSSLAARLNIFLAPGTMIEHADDRLFNTAYLFAPDGKIVGSQRQTHRSPQEIARGFAQGDELNVFDIGAARVGFVVGTDVEYPEVARILALQGANLLIHPAAYPRWHDEYFMLDLWRDVQSNQVFGLQACLVDDDFKGKSSVYAPVEMTDGHRGWLAQAARADAEEIVSAALDFDALQRVVDDYPIFGFFNHDFYAREFPGAYQGIDQ